MPKGEAFTDFATFDAGYEHLKRATGDFRNFTAEVITKAVFEKPICFVVLRAILGFTPPEWAYETSVRTPIRVDQGAARAMDKALRSAPLVPRQDRGGVTDARIKAMVVAAVRILAEGVGDVDQAGVSYRKTKRAERVLGFDQAPDFIIPNEANPAVIIEAKLSEDDGTARDKVTRVQHLRTLRDRERKNYEIVACIAGRGFKVRREDMRRLLEATDGKVFTLETIDRLLDATRIRDFVTRISVGKSAT